MQVRAWRDACGGKTGARGRRRGAPGVVSRGESVAAGERREKKEHPPSRTEEWQLNHHRAAHPDMTTRPSHTRKLKATNPAE